jgi:hypothetical protein
MAPDFFNHVHLESGEFMTVVGVNHSEHEVFHLLLWNHQTVKKFQLTVSFHRLKRPATLDKMFLNTLDQELNDQVIFMFDTIRNMVDEGIEMVPLKVRLLCVSFEWVQGRKGLYNSV